MRNFLHILKNMLIFATWIGWSSYQPIRGKSIAPSTSLMIDDTKRIDNMTKKKPLVNLLSEFEAKHNGKYDYSLVNEDNYVNCHSKIPVLCKEHGVFLVSPDNHKRGKGCPRCMGGVRLTRQEFVDKALKVHGKKYDYSLVNYVNAKTKVLIRCNECGTIFWQTPDNHLCGRGCPKCKWETIAQKRSSTKNEFINKAMYIHKKKYGYSKVDYKNNRTKVCVTCPFHGDFFITPNHHLGGGGCPICANKQKGKIKAWNRERFIKESIKTHGDKYGYDAVDYKGANIKVKILCKKHNRFFWQNPYYHTRGCGCPYCKTSKGEERIANFLNSKRITYIRQYKIENIDVNMFCSNKHILVDFYLPQYNCFVEFNGLQHYKSVKGWGGEIAFEAQQERDYALARWCVDNKIKLITIPYQKRKDIEEILIKELNI